MTEITNQVRPTPHCLPVSSGHVCLGRTRFTGCVTSFQDVHDREVESGELAQVGVTTILLLLEKSLVLLLGQLSRVIHKREEIGDFDFLVRRRRIVDGTSNPNDSAVQKLRIDPVRDR